MDYKNVGKGGAPAVEALPVGVRQGLVHVLAVPHEQAVAAEDALHHAESRKHAACC